MGEGDELVILLMTSRSGSSMVADIYHRHGFFWARNERQNPVVGGRKVRYRSFENQFVKDFNKTHFGIPLGDFVTYDDQILRAFYEMLRMEYEGQGPAMWKGAVEFFPLFNALAEAGMWNIKPVIIWRPKLAVMESLRAKRQGRVDEAKLVQITDKRYEMLGMLASDYAYPVVETDALVKGDRSSIEQAFRHWGHDYSEDVVLQTIKPGKWETDR